VAQKLPKNMFKKCLAVHPTLARHHWQKHHAPNRVESLHCNVCG